MPGRPGRDVASGTDEPSPVRLTVGVVAALTTAVMPTFLLGAVGLFVRRDLGLSALQLGVALSAFNGGWLVTAVTGGRLADRLGGRRTVALGVVSSGLVLLAIPAVSRWWQLVGASVLAGIANALVQPGASAALAHGVHVGRHGVALGMKGVNAPTAALLGGVAVPLLAVPHGWRWVFVAGAATVALYFLLTPAPWRSDPPEGAAGRRAPRNARLYGLVVAAAAGNAAATFLAGFFVEWQASTGLTEGAAGLLFAVGSGVGGVARVAWGALADLRRSDGIREASTLFVAGAMAFLLLAFDLAVPVDVVVTVVAFAAGWGWLGLLFLAVVRTAPDAPGDATGLLGLGLAIGGLTGPTALGALGDAAGLRTAWRVGAALLVVAAASCLAASRAHRD